MTEKTPFHISDFDEYIRQGEPEQRERAYNWGTAIGLQAVDGLQTSDYLRETARRNIEGEISINEAQSLINSYYQSKTKRAGDNENNEEADRTASNISLILSTDTLDFSTQGLVNLHRRIFKGVFKHAGRIRDYNITKNEWVLEGDTVRYLNWEDLNRAVDYDLEQERHFSYKGLSPDEMVEHVTQFVSGLWQIHAFGEGNTRTTAVFTILYLRSIGFKVDNELFANHSWYFRNALVRANYKSATKGIDYSPLYLERFFRNLLLGDQWDLRSRYLHIHPSAEWSVQPNLAEIDHPTSTRQVPDKLDSDNQNVRQLVFVIGLDEISIKEILDRIGLKDREHFMNSYLNPAIREGFVRLLYPDKPRHPRQKYLLTVKGLSLYNGLRV